MTKLSSHRDLDVWWKTLDLIDTVYRLSARWPEDERFGLTSQVRRAAVSVSANIAEGAGRFGTRDYIRFLGMARGSLAETDARLVLSVRLGITPEPQGREALEKAAEIGRMLTGLIRSLRNKVDSES